MISRKIYLNTFYICSLFFLLFFFIIPLLYTFNCGAWFLGDEYNIDYEQFMYVLMCVFIFIVGYFYFDFIERFVLYPKYLFKCKTRVVNNIGKKKVY